MIAFGDYLITKPDTRSIEKLWTRFKLLIEGIKDNWRWPSPTVNLFLVWYLADYVHAVCFN